MHVLQSDTRTEMRNSALAVIGAMCETYPLALLRHLDELTMWATDVLKLEPTPELRRGKLTRCAVDTDKVSKLTIVYCIR